MTNNYNASKLHIKCTFPYADIKGLFEFHVEVTQRPSSGAETVVSQPLELASTAHGGTWPPSNTLGATAPTPPTETLGHSRKPDAEATATTALRDPGRLHARPPGHLLPPRQAPQRRGEPTALPGDRPNLSLYARATLDPAGSLAGPPARQYRVRLLAPDAVSGGALILCAQRGPCPTGIQLQPGGKAGPTSLPRGLGQHARSSPVSFPSGQIAGPGQAPLCQGQSGLGDRTPCWNLRVATGQGLTGQNSLLLPPATCLPARLRDTSTQLSPCHVPSTGQSSFLSSTISPGAARGRGSAPLDLPVKTLPAAGPTHIHASPTPEHA